MSMVQQMVHCYCGSSISAGSAVLAIIVAAIKQPQQSPMSNTHRLSFQMIQLRWFTEDVGPYQGR